MPFKFHQHPLHELALSFSKDIYYLTGRFPEYEISGMIARLRSAVATLVEEIANSLTRQKFSEAESGIRHAIGLANKLAADLDLCRKLEYMDSATHAKFLAQCEDLVKRLHEFKDK